MKKRIATCLLLLPFVFSACQSNDDTPPIIGNGEVEIWSTYATEKILQDKTDIYDDVRMPARVSVEACKGEYEGAQVIMTATKDVSAYDAELVSDLVNADGEVFSKANVALYHQKYIEIEDTYYNQNEPVVGWYPDALLPLDVAVDFEENKIKEGNNQGIYLSFDVPVNQKAGVYNGNLKITYDGKESLVPIALTVYDLTVSQETRSLSYFNLGFSGYLGELDGTQNVWRSYVEKMIDYRLAPGSVMMTTTPTQESLENTIDEIVDLVLNYGLSTISVPSSWRTGTNLSNFVVELAKKSIELNYNFLARTVVKGTDEPKANQLETVKTETQNFHNSIAKAVNEIASLTGATPEFLAELKASAEAIPHIVTFNYQRSEQTDAANIDTYCTLFNFWNSESNRALYDDQTKGRWWYGCSGPSAPYPSYHIDDTMVSPRSVGWMMSEYDIVGNLYWSMTVYAAYDGTKYSPLDNVYDTPTRYPNTNGDGFLFYPGAPYGIDGPISSMRLEAIRDGNEEYEILYDLKKDYEEAGYSFADIQRNVSELVYSGTMVQYENISARFAEARKAIIELAMLAKEGVFITDVENDQKGHITYSIVADKDYVVKENGTVLSGTQNGEYKNYTLTMTLEKDSNDLNLSVETAEKVYSLQVSLGGKVEYYTAETLYKADLFTKGTATADLSLSGDNICLNVGAVTGMHQNVRSSIFESLDANVHKLVLEVENPVQEDMYIWILVRYEGQALGADWYKGTLKAGKNLIEIDFTAKPIKGKISFSEFYFSETNEGTHEAKSINVQSMTVYHKEA